MAITFVGAWKADDWSAEFPLTGDNHSSLSVTLPAALQTGDLMAVWVGSRSTTHFVYIAGCGGLTWTAWGGQSGNNLLMNLYWAVYDAATWKGDNVITAQWTGIPARSELTNGGLLQISTNAATTGTMSLKLFVFRPTAGKTFQADTAPVKTNFAAPVSPFTVTIPGITVSADSVTLGLWYSADDNSWGTIAGAGWVYDGYSINQSGLDVSIASAYYITTVGGATGDVSLNQTFQQPDAGMVWIGSWKEV